MYGEGSSGEKRDIDGVALVEAHRLQYLYGSTELVKLDGSQILNPVTPRLTVQQKLFYSMGYVFSLAFIFASLAKALAVVEGEGFYLSDVLIGLALVAPMTIGLGKLFKDASNYYTAEAAWPTIPASARDAWLRIRSVANEHQNELDAPMDLMGVDEQAWRVVREISRHARAGSLTSPEAQAALDSLYSTAAQLDTYALLKRQAGIASTPSEPVQVLSSFDITTSIELAALEANVNEDAEQTLDRTDRTR